MFAETEPERRQESGGERSDDPAEEPLQGGKTPGPGEQAAGEEGKTGVGEGGEGRLHEQGTEIDEQGEKGQTQVDAPEDEAGPSSE